MYAIAYEICIIKTWGSSLNEITNRDPNLIAPSKLQIFTYV